MWKHFINDYIQNIFSSFVSSLLEGIFSHLFSHSYIHSSIHRVNFTGCSDIVNLHQCKYIEKRKQKLNTNIFCHHQHFSPPYYMNPILRLIFVNKRKREKLKISLLRGMILPWQTAQPEMCWSSSSSSSFYRIFFIFIMKLKDKIYFKKMCENNVNFFYLLYW